MIEAMGKFVLIDCTGHATKVLDSGILLTQSQSKHGAGGFGSYGTVKSVGPDVTKPVSPGDVVVFNGGKNPTIIDSDVGILLVEEEWVLAVVRDD